MDRKSNIEVLSTSLLSPSLQLDDGGDNRDLVISPSFEKKKSIKDIYQNRKQNISLDELAAHRGYRVYYRIFVKVRRLLIFLGLFAPKGGGTASWCLRRLYPIFIYGLILYPWTTFVTQEAYWSVPVFLFITLHLSGIFAYHSACRYWKSNHLATFITATFIPFDSDLSDFKRTYKNKRDNRSSDDDVHANVNGSSTGPTALHLQPDEQRRMSLKKGFQQRFQKDAKKRKKTFDISESMKTICAETAANMHKGNSASGGVQFQSPYTSRSWDSIVGHENKLSLSLFFEAVQRMWRRFWMFTALTMLLIIGVLCMEIISPSLQSAITDQRQIESDVFADIFIPCNVFITFVRIFYNTSEFIFMAVYFQFLCECHCGDLLIHFHYYDTADIEQKYRQVQRKNGRGVAYFDALQCRLASIVWDWDRIASSTRDTSKSIRWWIFVMCGLNLIAGVTAVVNLSLVNSITTQIPQHLEMYLPAIANLLLSFYVLLTGVRVSHMNNVVHRRTYFLVANTHFGHIELKEHMHGGGVHGCSNEVQEDEVGENAALLLRQQNILIQTQSVAHAVNTRRIGISVYGMVLNRNLFLAFLSPFIAFALFCLNKWLPDHDTN